MGEDISGGKKKSFLLVDGSSLLFRGFYAVRDLRTKDGIYTNGVYAFMSMFLKAMEEWDPDYVCVAFDRQAPTHRAESYEGYKANREKAPDELQPQFGLTKDLLEAMNIRQLSYDGWEADDIVGSLSLRGEEAGLKNYLLTGDRDYFQLVSPDTTVLYTRKGISQLEVVDLAAIQEQYGLEPGQLIDVKGLQGDASDNIPGVPGVGPKTALRLVREYGDMDGVYTHLDQISGKKLKENLEDYKTQAYMSRQLGTICRDLPIEYAIEDFIRQPVREEALREQLDRLEFRSFASRLGLEGKKTRTEESFPARMVGREGWQELAEKLEGAEGFSFALLADGENYIHSSALYLLAKPAGDETSYVVDLRNWDGEGREAFVRLFQPVFASDKRKLAYHVKKDLVLLYQCGIAMEGSYEDLMLMEYLIDPGIRDYNISKLAEEYLGRQVKSQEEVLGKGKGRRTFDQLPEKDLLSYAGGLLNTVEDAYQPLKEKIRQMGMEELFNQIENPLAAVLGRMEIQGMKVDREKFQSLGEEYRKQMEFYEDRVYQEAGEVFNINSPQQLGEILFEKMGLPHGKKTKTGYSTAEAVLEKISDEPIVADVLRYRKMAKLVSTYIDGFAPYISPDGRIRSTFTQTVAATGRLSSTEPNLQNIPARSEEGHLLRQIFVADEGMVLIDADYSQIELRILASLSGDPTMLSAFQSGLDIHRQTAAEVNGIPYEEVSDSQRSHAKAVNFGIIYGISAFGLSRQLGISRQEAQDYIDSYKATYPEVGRYMEEIVEKARERGYVDTHYGRRRQVPELRSSNFHTRQFGERIALNTPIQGTAADVIKIAMVRVDQALKERGYRARLVLQVHDELILECPEEEKGEVARLLDQIMEGVGDFAVELKADENIGKSWYEAES